MVIEKLLENYELYKNELEADLYQMCIRDRFMDDSIASERERAMEMNLEIMRHCDEVHVFGHQISFGMLQEMQAAKKLGIPVVQEEVE